MDDWRLVAGQLRRLRIDLATGACDVSVIRGLAVDSLYVHPDHVGRRHRYSYGEMVAIGADGQQNLQLVKVDHDTNRTRLWMGQDLRREVPACPMFAPNPCSGCEDDGVLISYVRDHPTGNSFVVVLDAASFREVAFASPY